MCNAIKVQDAKWITLEIKVLKGLTWDPSINFDGEVVGTNLLSSERYLHYQKTTLTLVTCCLVGGGIKKPSNFFIFFILMKSLGFYSFLFLH
jgi:hypothetical protein